MTSVDPNILIIGQRGRLSFEALLFLSSLRLSDPDFSGRVIVAEPEAGENWRHAPHMTKAMHREFEKLGGEVVSFKNSYFGEQYPYGNKIESLMAMPKGEPFIFFDSDTVVTGKLSEIDFNFNSPAASMRREDTWPKIELYGPNYSEIWKSLYDKFGLDFERSLDLSFPDEYWQRYMYFNAGWFFGKCPHEFGRQFLGMAVKILTNPPPELVCQELNPWLDQVTLPLVINCLGGGRPSAKLSGLDGDVTCHWRVLPLAYARESDSVIDVIEAAAQPIADVLSQYAPMKQMIFDGHGAIVRGMFDRNDLPRKEQGIRNRIRREGYWVR